MRVLRVVNANLAAPDTGGDRQRLVVARLTRAPLSVRKRASRESTPRHSHGTTTERPDRLVARFRIARRSESPRVRVADAPSSSEAVAPELSADAPACV
jgi:hypothetical protein